MTDYPRCRTCKWWGRQNEWSFADWSDDDGCGRRVCALTETYRSGRLVDGRLVHECDRKAEAVGGQESILSTSPDFGCVQHEPREDGGE